MTMLTMPEPKLVGERAAQILDAMHDHPGYDRLRGSSMKYSTCWATFTGYPVISQWSLERDADPLLTEALRILALKAAVFELTDGNEDAAELLVPAPVDAVLHRNLPDSCGRIAPTVTPRSPLTARVCEVCTVRLLPRLAGSTTVREAFA